MPSPGYPFVRATHIAMMMTGENGTTALNHYNKVLLRCPELKPTQALMDLGVVSQLEWEMSSFFCSKPDSCLTESIWSLSQWICFQELNEYIP
jgi:hypothetical protein